MPIYLFTLHAYRSWREDNPRGYVRRGVPGIQKPDPKLAAHRASIARHPPTVFTAAHTSVMLDAMPDTCARRDCDPLAASITATHLHVLASWSGGDDRAKAIEAGLKSGLGFVLSESIGATGNRWFSRGGVPERVNDHEHMAHLIGTYLPKHETEQHGKFRRYDINPA